MQESVPKRGRVNPQIADPQIITLHCITVVS